MTAVTFKGNPAERVGRVPEVGETAPDWRLVQTDLSEATQDTWAGKRKVLNVFPSLDTGTCANSVRRFNQEAGQLDNTVVVNVSKDLPFAHKRFCEAEGVQKAVNVSAFRSSFGRDYGVELTNTPLQGLLARTVLVLDENNRVVYQEQVSEITQEPNYERALEALRQAQTA